MDINKVELLEKISIENKGILKTADAVQAGVSRTYFLEYVKKNGYEKLDRGIYLSSDAWEDGMYVLQTKYKNTIFSHETALYLLNLADREPLQYTVTVKHGYNPRNIVAQGAKVYTVKDDWYSLGIIETESPMGHKVRVYNAERTICDILRKQYQIEVQERQVALKGYVRKADRNLPQLMEYAELFKVDKVLRYYLEVLL